MATVFYIIMAFYLLFEVFCLVGVKKVAAGVDKYKGVTDVSKMSSTYATFVVLNCVYLFLCFVGLLSSQWLGFMLMILLSFIPKRWITWRIIDGVLTIAILVFIILNKYHFHIDLTECIIKILVQ